MPRRARRANSSPRSARGSDTRARREPAPDRLIVVVDNLDALSPGRGRELDRRRSGRDRTRLHRLVGFRSRPAYGGAGRPARGAPASWQMAASHGQPAGPQGRRRRARGRPPPVGEARSRRRRRIRRLPRRSSSRCRARKRRCLRRSRRSPRIRRATPSASSTPIAWRAARTRRGAVMALMQAVAFADDDDAGGDARAARQWIGRTDRDRRSARLGRSRQGGARRQ